MAKFIVTGGEVDGIDRKMCEIKRQLRQRSGSPLDPKLVNFALQGILEPEYGAKNGLWTTESILNLSTRITLRLNGYLDTSFEGKEFHPLTIRPLTKEQALDEYRQSGGKTWIWDELEKNMLYTVPKAETIDVMIMNFGRDIGSDEAVAEMDKLGVRPLTYEELIQYGIEHPEHQKQKVLVGLGTKHTLDGNPRAPILGLDDDVRSLIAYGWGRDWGGLFRFLVVRK